MQRLKLGMIGSGFVANFHARALMQVRGVEIAGVTSRTAANAERFSKMVREQGLGEGVVYSSIAEMAFASRSSSRSRTQSRAVPS